MKRSKGSIEMLMLIVAVISLLGMARFSWGIFSVVGGGQYDGCDLIIPQFGRIECEPISHVPIYNKLDFDFGDHRSEAITAKCGDDENSPSCGILSVTCSEGMNRFSFQSDALIGECSIGSDDWCAIEVQGDIEKSIATNIDIGTTFRVGGCYHYDFWWGLTKWGKGNIKQYYIPYGLNVYDSGGKFRYDASDCALDSLQYADKIRVCIESGEEACQKVKISSTLGFDDWVNYLSAWVVAPIDVQNKIVTYDGQLAYCQVNSVYSMDKFEVESGCYAYPLGKMADVTCCPEMETANAICGDDFLWHPKKIGECDTDNDCTIIYGSGYECISHKCYIIKECMSDFDCSGFGSWYPDYSASTPTACMEGCVNGFCKEKECKSVDCVPPSRGCESGYLCNPDTFKCEKQEGPSIECGDLVCSAPWEDMTNCPEDCFCGKWDYGCKLSVWFNANKYAVIFIILLVGGVMFTIKR